VDADEDDFDPPPLHPATSRSTAAAAPAASDRARIRIAAA
jgi:hypothetical protein